MTRRHTIRAADLFCGAGGASTGFVRACEALGIHYELIAVNHWPVAVDTHSTNHPHVRHLCESVEKIDPREVVPGGRLHLLLAGPECTHFSTARGGRPVNPQSRASAWHILKWAQELYIDTILIENVPEFRTWGPVGVHGRPLKSGKGQTYRAFIEALKSLGYRVEDRILNAADYGDPTTRRRLFIMARRGRHQIVWPTPTHSKTGGATLFGKTKRWRAAREVIDWNVKGKSIFGRKKPLKPATIARILAGLEKFAGHELQPFLVLLRRNMTAKSIDGPLPTLTAGGQHVGLAQPFLMHITHAGREDRSRSLDEPLPTITTAKRGEIGMVESFILPQHGGGVLRPAAQPLPTITTDGAIAVIEPFIVDAAFGRGDHTRRTASLDDPIGTITGSNRFALAQPFLVQTHERRLERVDLVESPMRTITANGGRCFGLAEPFLTKYNRTAKGAYSVDEPIGTISTRDRFGLVQPVIDGYVLDIHFRMLQPHELAAATSFPKSYVFKGTREDVVKQIGNSWPGELSYHLNRAALLDYAPARREKLEATA